MRQAPLGRWTVFVRARRPARWLIFVTQLIERRWRALAGAETRETAAHAHGYQLLAAAVRDLRAPLSALVAMSVAIADGAVTDSATLRSYQREIGAEALQVMSLVDALFAQIQVESTPVAPRRAMTRLAELAALSIEAARGRAQRLGVTLALQAEDAIPLVFVDADEVGRAFDRLLQNAIRHTPAGGVVLVRLVTAPATDSSVEGAGDALIQVIDSGEGIPTDRLARVFVAPSHADIPSTSGAAVGFGLPLTARAVQAHGGRIWAESPLPPELRSLIAATSRVSQGGATSADFAGTVVGFTLPIAQ